LSPSQSGGQHNAGGGGPYSVPLAGASSTYSGASSTVSSSSSPNPKIWTNSSATTAGSVNH